MRICWARRGVVLAMVFAGMIDATGRAEPAEGERRVELRGTMVVNESERGNPGAMVDEQDAIGDPPGAEATSAWEIDSRFWKEFPYAAHLDLGAERNLSRLWIYDINAVGKLAVYAGEPGRWREVATIETKAYKQWTAVALDVTTRYLRLERKDAGCNFAEIALYEYTPEAHRARIEREAALARAREEAARRPVVDLGTPLGEVRLVDEVDLAAESPGHRFVEDPPGASRVETLLGRPCRVLRKTPDESAYFAVRLGEMKLLRPGATYVVEVEYPEDAPRSMIVMNGGNETSKGFHTGETFGDAFHPKYVNNNNESLDVPLSGRFERWQLVFELHDRFPDLRFLRGKGLRALGPEDGFWVTIAQFSAADDPASRGAAAARIRLYEVPEPARLAATIHFPPEGLPRRHVFWREEMADGVIEGEGNERGLDEMLDWYRFKAATMRRLGINTFTKDLLEFGACQHWDSTPGGGNRWVHFSWRHKDLWGGIVELMGREGFDLLPYYEYAGSKGDQGLGYQRRSKPLGRDDAYTHIRWIESANADITDPDTYADLKKMLDLTIVAHKDQARFVGAWFRPRSQWPISFADATLARFAAEANGGRPVARRNLIDDKPLLDRYYDWWYGKRREFLVAMRDHLRASGVDPEAVVLFTADPSEPGPSFPTWEKRFVTDRPQLWQERLKDPAVSRGKDIRPLAVDEVLRGDLYLQALLAPRLNWGGWEVDHSSPPPDPARYQQTEGVLLTHAFNRAYTVGSPKTFETFRGPSGLAIVRHYTLNENMMFDRQDREKLGYFVADVERAGPYCMLAEVRAVANGDPYYIGYLVGSNFGRGFPRYVRRFNEAFLALPALPSRLVADATDDAEVVVRAIDTPRHGTFLAVANTGLTPKPNVTLRLPRAGRLTDAATGAPLADSADQLTLSMDACELRALRIH